MYVHVCFYLCTKCPSNIYKANYITVLLYFFYFYFWTSLCEVSLDDLVLVCNFKLKFTFHGLLSYKLVVAQVGSFTLGLYCVIGSGAEPKVIDLCTDSGWLNSLPKTGCWHNFLPSQPWYHNWDWHVRERRTFTSHFAST